MRITDIPVIVELSPDKVCCRGVVVTVDNMVTMMVGMGGVQVALIRWPHIPSPLYSVLHLVRATEATAPASSGRGAYDTRVT